MLHCDSFCILMLSWVLLPLLLLLYFVTIIFFVTSIFFVPLCSIQKYECNEEKRGINPARRTGRGLLFNDLSHKYKRFRLDIIREEDAVPPEERKRPTVPLEER